MPDNRRGYFLNIYYAPDATILGFLEYLTAAKPYILDGEVKMKHAQPFAIKRVSNILYKIVGRIIGCMGRKKERCAVADMWLPNIGEAGF